MEKHEEWFARRTLERLLAEYHAGTIDDYAYMRLCHLARQFGIKLK